MVMSKVYQATLGHVYQCVPVNLVMSRVPQLIYFVIHCRRHPKIPPVTRKTGEQKLLCT